MFVDCDGRRKTALILVLHSGNLWYTIAIKKG